MPTNPLLPEPNATLSIAIPTYQRSSVVLETTKLLQKLQPTALEILIIDQTEQHPPEIFKTLNYLDQQEAIRWIRLPKPSIPHAMNIALKEAKGEIVLFLDDDIVPDGQLIASHYRAHKNTNFVAGQVIQPGESPLPLKPGEAFRFNSTEPCLITDFMGGNFSIKRAIALDLGGFDENFKGAAFNFETEFASRFVKTYGPIKFVPSATLNHLRLQRGGTRVHGHHLRTLKPTHSVGAYYYFLKAKPKHWLLQMVWRPLRAIRTRHHFSQPWWILPSLLAEIIGFVWALRLLVSGPKYIELN